MFFMNNTGDDALDGEEFGIMIVNEIYNRLGELMSALDAVQDVDRGQTVSGLAMDDAPVISLSTTKDGDQVAVVGLVRQGALRPLFIAIHDEFFTKMFPDYDHVGDVGDEPRPSLRVVPDDQPT